MTGLSDSICIFVDFPPNNGQNLAAGFGSWADVIREWNAEGNGITIGQRCSASGNDDLNSRGHFTQVTLII